jgi:hypothetical protein
MKHEEVRVLRDIKYLIVDKKYIDGHNFRCGCLCSGLVLNLLTGRRTWTRIRFDCGEMIKINCHCLEETTE